MSCPYCKSLQVNPNTYFHQAGCPDYGGLKHDADVMRNRLNGVELGMWADTVLTTHPKNNMVKQPKTIGKDGLDEFGQPNYIVEWVYAGFTLRFERAEREHPTYGKISTYAVQEIKYNNEHKSQSTRKFRSAVGKQKGRHSVAFGSKRRRPGK